MRESDVKLTSRLILQQEIIVAYNAHDAYDRTNATNCHAISGRSECHHRSNGVEIFHFVKQKQV